MDKKTSRHHKGDRGDAADEKTAAPSEIGGSTGHRDGAPASPRPEESPHRGEQPGGGKHSESERPSSPDSRWGGGRKP